MVRAAGAGTSTALLGRSWADGLVRSSQGPWYGHWPEWGLGASPLDWARGRGPAGMRAEVRPGCQISRFQSRWHAEVATTGLLVDERA
jgi:hypothetical protein